MHLLELPAQKQRVLNKSKQQFPVITNSYCLLFIINFVIIKQGKLLKQ